MQLKTLFSIRQGQVYYECAPHLEGRYYEIFVKSRPRMVARDWMEILVRARVINAHTGTVEKNEGDDEVTGVCYPLTKLDPWTRVTRCRGQAIRWAKEMEQA